MQSPQFTALSPQEERATTVMIPVLGESPEGVQAAPEKGSAAWLALLFAGALAMFGMWSLFGGEPPAAPSAQTNSATPQGPAENPLAQVTINATPSDAKIQVAAVSLGATVTQNGTLTAQVQAGEAIAITVSLDGYQTVQETLSAEDGVQEIRLTQSLAPNNEAKEIALSSPPKAPAKPRSASALPPPRPRACLD